MQQSEDAKSTQSKMETLRLNCEREIQTQLKEMESVTSSFSEFLDSINITVQETVKTQAKMLEMKARLREVEEEYVKVLAVKTRKEAKQMAVKESISTTVDRIEELQKTLQAQTTKRDAAQQSLGLQNSEEQQNGDAKYKLEIQQAISWYNRVLGFQINGGHGGVKFTFKSINVKYPQEEYSFTIRHEYDSDTYILLDCKPCLHETKELIRVLNKTNDLFGFVRVMRQKFQEATSQGVSSHFESPCEEESRMVHVSAPVLSGSSVRSDISMKENEHTPDEVERDYKKMKHGKWPRKLTTSPASVRRSPRLQINKLN